MTRELDTYDYFRTQPPLSEVQVKPGVRVMCRFAHLDRLGKIAKIVAKDSPYFHVEWEDGCTKASIWGCLDSFTLVSDDVVVKSTNSIVAVNDYTCPHCKNDRCSRSERTCWKCGGVL